jgi:hypothetical protein
MHRHHEKGDGKPFITQHDEFIIVIGDPLAKRPLYFIGNCPHRGVKTTTMRHQGKRMSATSAKVWTEFLHTLGKEAFLAIHHEPRKIISKK